MEAKVIKYRGLQDPNTLRFRGVMRAMYAEANGTGCFRTEYWDRNKKDRVKDSGMYAYLCGENIFSEEITKEEADKLIKEFGGEAPKKITQEEIDRAADKLRE